MSYEKKLFCAYTSNILSGQARQLWHQKIPQLKYAKIKTSSIL